MSDLFLLVDAWNDSVHLVIYYTIRNDAASERAGILDLLEHRIILTYRRLMIASLKLKHKLRSTTNINLNEIFLMKLEIKWHQKPLLKIRPTVGLSTLWIIV